MTEEWGIWEKEGRKGNLNMIISYKLFRKQMFRK